MLEQSLCQVVRRYDSFLASVLERSGISLLLPETIGILTWNYDRLLERAYHQYCPELHIVHEVITSSPQIKRLNGLLGRAINKGTGDEYNLNFRLDERGVYERVSQEFEALNTGHPTMRFAFESGFSRVLDDVQLLFAKADTLVVIGYSFPFFNRKSDKLILDTLSSIERVFLQVLPEDAKAIETRMRSLKGDLPKIQFVDDQDLFFVPHDF